MHYRVKALAPGGEVVVYGLEAADEQTVRRLLSDRGERLLALRPQFALRSSGMARVPLVAFSQELVALLDAGLPLLESLQTLAEKEANAGVRRALEQICARLCDGLPLSAALEEQPASFPPLYVATVRASERTGAIREALVRFVAYQQQVDQLRQRVISASIYPLVLVGAGLAVTAFLLAYVVPRFSAVYEDLGQGLPLASRLLMQWGRLLEEHAFLVGAVALAALAGIASVFLRRDSRARLVAAFARIPAVGRYLHLYQLARLYRTVGMLLRGGMPAVHAFDLAGGLLDARLRPALALATQRVREGQSLAESLERHGLTTPVAVRMLRVGERSGSMGEMMERIAAFHDDDLARAVDLLTRLIEPALMTVIGLVIGAIVVLMYFPIFELAGSLQ